MKGIITGTNKQMVLRVDGLGSFKVRYFTQPEGGEPVVVVALGWTLNTLTDKWMKGQPVDPENGPLTGTYGDEFPMSAVTNFKNGALTK